MLRQQTANRPLVPLMHTPVSYSLYGFENSELLSVKSAKASLMELNKFICFANQLLISNW